MPPQFGGWHDCGAQDCGDPGEHGCGGGIGDPASVQALTALMCPWTPCPWCGHPYVIAELELVVAVELPVAVPTLDV
jgi:hypothetical protein